MKKASSLIEILVVIIIAGILAVSIQTEELTDIDMVSQEKVVLKKHIEYLQQLNLNQNFYNGADETWYNKTDCLDFDKANGTYTFNNTNRTILNPLDTSEPTFTITLRSTLDLPTNFDRLCFDNLGRPFKDNLLLTNLLDNNINILLQTPSNDYNETITIHSITGFIE